MSKVLFLILLNTWHFRKGILDDTVFVNKTLTYSDAVNYCNKEHNGNVWDHSKYSRNIVEHTEIWEDRYISSWISVRGCYRRNTSTPPKNTSIAFRGNWKEMVIDCFSKCNGDTVGLHNTTCICIRAIQLRNDDFLNNSDSKCSYDGWIGGKTLNFVRTYYTIYKKVETEQISGETDNVYLQCVYQNCKNRTTYNLFAADCNIPLRQTLCKCSAVLFDGTGQKRSTKKHCTEKYPFICVKPNNTGNEYTPKTTSATPSTTSSSNREKVNFPTVPQVSTNTTNEVNTIQTTTTAPPGFEIKYILIAASVLFLLIVMIAAGLLGYRKYKRKSKAELVLLQKQPNNYVDLNADSSGTANTDNSVIPPTNSDEINNLTRTQTIRNYEEIENKGLNGNGHYVVGGCDITSNAKSDEYDTIKETTEKDNYDTFQPNKDNSVVTPSEYSTTREVTENSEYDTFQKDRNVLSSVGMYDTTKNLNINSEYDVFKNSKENEHQSEDYATAKDVMKESEYDMIKK